MRCVATLALLLALLLCFLSPALGETMPVEPERFASDALEWTFDESTGTLSIHGAGPMRSYWEDSPEWEQYQDQIRCVQVDEGVTSIGDCAFYNCGSLQKIMLPDSIEVIDRYAFYYCWALSSITIPKSLRYVGEMAFYNTCLHEPGDIIFPEGLEYIGDNAFHSALKTGGYYSLPSSTRYIGACALSNAMVSDILVDEGNAWYKAEDHALLTKDGKTLLMYAPDARETRYAVPDGVEKICEECFNVPQHLEELYIPASVKEIEDAAIFTTFNLRQISVSPENQAYKIIDDALCTSDGKVYLAFPDGIAIDEIIIPDGVERIASYLFYGRGDQKLAITLPASLKAIGTLSMPQSISTIRIPKGLQTIDPFAFYFTSNIDEILYNATPSDWQTIFIQEGNDILQSTTIRYVG